ncbi:CPBP family intramembrane metalloprotease [Clostridium tagluense]|uniref:type II CAAX endopeptidase family protein n=1 Tax=Clostridium tagluense TaxID=360422 RepID=UPI001CF24F0D|nr:type II CAAX endopeptidase family protein [Clostridium tagluense]MCB2310821.1 CPBP family intramembrane metalloprotease [Clostridium tagluense]MCB2315449.1 CPBP family intramembrane metalloprotease [Clostridium tagluense]MCB2320302.1 CPBP family intramembrane metalloprotease [Clostridium tagluense]MCB2325414.1 CPBP family intramembrane metalloprotease [Clostridium tagluense]MCB2330266.1 CPBP family intramembrane metalloprotease [Clostridium tagluense]
MDENLKQTKDEVSLFLFITFLITFLMGGFMLYVHKTMINVNLATFAGVQMFYPAFVVIALKMFYYKEEINNNILIFYKVYIGLFIISFAIQILGVFLFPHKLEIVQAIMLSIFSIVTFSLVTKNKENCFDKINMVFGKNFKMVIILALIFFILKLVVSLVYAILPGQVFSISGNDISKTILSIITIPINIVLIWIMFFGEEFAWRGYLQPRLQVMFGKKLGVIILGVIWGFWHFPLCFMLYSPATPILCVISHVFYCTIIGVFLGYVYMKTGNLWSVIIIHIINNSSLSAEAGYGAILTLKDVAISILLFAIVYLPFIFTKEYKADKNEFNIQE